MTKKKNKEFLPVGLSFDDDRHNNRCTAGEEETVFGDLTSHGLDEVTSLDTLIIRYEFLIGCTDSFEDLLVDGHHLMRMDESSWIDEYVSCDRASTAVFFKSKGKDSILREHLSIPKRISSDNPDRWIVDIECIECVFEGMSGICFPTKHEYLSRFHFFTSKCKCTLLFLKEKAWGCPTGRKRRWKEWKSDSCRGGSDGEDRFGSIGPDEKLYISDSTGWYTRSKEFEESAFIQELGVIYTIAEFCYKLSRSINWREFECRKDIFKEFNTHGLVGEYPCIESLFLREYETHIGKSRIWLTCSWDLSESRTYENCSGIRAEEEKWILHSFIWKDHASYEIHIILIREEWRFHPSDETR